MTTQGSLKHEAEITLFAVNNYFFTLYLFVAAVENFMAVIWKKIVFSVKGDFE